MYGAPFHEGGELECERFSAAGGEYCQERLAVDGGAGGVFLEGFAVVGAESVEAEEAFEIGVHVEAVVAVGAALGAACVAEDADHILHVGVIVEYPRRCDRAVVGGAYEGECVGQLGGVAVDEACNVGVGANLAGVLRED